MLLSNVANFRGSMTIARANLPEILARHTVQAINRLAVLAGTFQEREERLPVVTPIGVVANAVAQFGFLDLTAHPFIQDVLVAGKDRFHADHDRTAASLRQLFDQRRRESL